MPFKDTIKANGFYYLAQRGWRSHRIIIIFEWSKTPLQSPSYPAPPDRYLWVICSSATRARLGYESITTRLLGLWWTIARVTIITSWPHRCCHSWVLSSLDNIRDEFLLRSNAIISLSASSNNSGSPYHRLRAHIHIGAIHIASHKTSIFPLSTKTKGYNTIKRLLLGENIKWFTHAHYLPPHL